MKNLIFQSNFLEVSPQLVYKFIEQTMQPGPSVSLKCSATGNPTPQISWNLDGFPLPNVNTFSLILFIFSNNFLFSKE